MILATRNHGHHELRTSEFGSTLPPPPRYRNGYAAFSGVNVSMERAIGLPVVSAAIWLVAEVVAGLDLVVYTGRKTDPTRRRDEKSWQAQLVDRPTLDGTRFDWYSDMNAGVEGYGNAFAQKIRFRGRIVEMPVIDPDDVRIRRENGRKVFDVHYDDKRGTVKGLTPADILHVRGRTLGGSFSGLSPISVHRHSIGNLAAMEEFAGRYFSNDATPPFALKVPGNVAKAKAAQTLEVFEATHGTLANKFRPAMLTNGSDIVKIGVSLTDALFVDGYKLGIDEVARMFRIPAALLEQAVYRTQVSVEQDALRFLAFSLSQRLRRFQDALAADTDLFAGTGLYPEFDTSSLVAIDAATRNTIQHEQIQDGRRLVDELRAEDGLDPLPPVPEDWTQEPGKVPQITPVGGAKNPEVPTEPADDGNDDTPMSPRAASAAPTS